MNALHTTIAPHGGQLINRLPEAGPGAEALWTQAERSPRLPLNDVARADLELIATGVYSPLTGFFDQAQYRSVVDELCLPNGLPWTIPITLPVSDEDAARLAGATTVALTTADDRIIGLLELTEVYPLDPPHEARQVYLTDDTAHPGVARLFKQGGRALAGPIWLLQPPDPVFPGIYRTPAQTRALFQERGWRRIVAFQTRNPIHRAHEYLLKSALEMADGLLVHPLVGETKSDDVPAAVRVASYHALLDRYFPAERVVLSAFPAAMRYAGPREAVFHALCRKNYGCTHFIVGRDHAGVGSYYGTFDAQRIFDRFDPQAIGITPLMFEHAFYCRACGQVATSKTCPHPSQERLTLSGTQVRALLTTGDRLPVEFTRPEVSDILRAAYQNTSSPSGITETAS